MDQSLVTIENETPLADSRQMARQLGIEERSFFSLITEYQEEIEEDFGQLRFEIAVGHREQGGGNPQKYAMLTEDQAYVYLTYSKNTEQARKCKRMLVKAFAEARKQISQPQPTPVYQLTAPVFNWHEAVYGNAICAIPTRRQLENAIITTVQMLQPHQTRGVTITDMMQYNAEIQAHCAYYGYGDEETGLLNIAEKLKDAGMLTRPEWKGGPFRYTFPSDVKQLQ